MDVNSKPTASQVAPLPTDMLRCLFTMQGDLNDYVFSKNEITASDGTKLTMQAISEQAMVGQLGVNDLPNHMVAALFGGNALRA